MLPNVQIKLTQELYSGFGPFLQYKDAPSNCFPLTYDIRLNGILGLTDTSHVLIYADANWSFGTSLNAVYALTPPSLGKDKRWWSWLSNAPSVLITCSFHYTPVREKSQETSASCLQQLCINSTGCLLSPTMPCLISPLACRANLTPLKVGDAPLDSRMVGEWCHGLVSGVEKEEQTKSYSMYG